MVLDYRKRVNNPLILSSIEGWLFYGAHPSTQLRVSGFVRTYKLDGRLMTTLGIFITILTLVIIIFRIKVEVERNRLSIRGGIILGLAFALALASIVSVALLTNEDAFTIRFSVLALCIVLVFLSYKLARRLIQTRTPNHSK